MRDVEDLLPLALSRPHEALTGARLVLAGQPSPHDASVAHQAAAIALREFGDVNAAVGEVRAALRLARQSGSPERVCDVLGTQGVALVYAGRTTQGMAAFDQALGTCDGVLAAKVMMRRSMMLWTLGRHAAALADMRHVMAVIRRAGDNTWLARALNFRGMIYVTMGQGARADADFAAASRLWAQTPQQVEAIHTIGNRALVAIYNGDLPTALRYLDEAADRYRPLNVPTTANSIDRCIVLLAAGLAQDALAEATAALRDIGRIRGRSTKNAELLLTAARCALAANQPQTALGWAQSACGMFRSQRSAWWLARAELVRAHARYAAEPASVTLLRQVERAAARLEAVDASEAEAADAHLLAGRLALALGRRDDAEHHLLAAARGRRKGPPMSRVYGWLGEALRAEAAGNPRQMLAACRRGLAVLDEHRYAFGASELRAQATAHGTELAALAQHYAASARQPRLLLAWSERWRATALAVPPVRPTGDAELNTRLARLRKVTRDLERIRREEAPTPLAKQNQVRLERELRRLEAEVRNCALRASADAMAKHGVTVASELLDNLGAAHLIELIDVDGLIYVLACGSGKVRQLTAGSATAAARAADFARFALRRLARGRPGDDPSSALAILDAAGSQLQHELFGPAVKYLGDGPVIIVPPGRFHSTPWSLIPVLRERVVSVAASAAAWMRAAATPPPLRRHVTLACGPGLASKGAEVPAVAPLYDDVTVLTDGNATTRNVLRALDGAWLAHVAAHGTFRADSPLFSSLRMHDGPLTVYDLEQLDRAPYRLILPSCDSGLQAPAGADELLGLVASLLPLGTGGIVAAVVPVNDNVVVPLMTDLHRYLRAGQTLAEAMCTLRAQRAGDPLEHAAAVSLIPLGAA